MIMMILLMVLPPHSPHPPHPPHHVSRTMAASPRYAAVTPPLLLTVAVTPLLPHTMVVTPPTLPQPRPVAVAPWQQDKLTTMMMIRIPLHQRNARPRPKMISARPPPPPRRREPLRHHHPHPHQ